MLDYLTRTESCRKAADKSTLSMQVNMRWYHTPILIRLYFVLCTISIMYINFFSYDSCARPPPIGGPRRLPSLPMPKAGSGVQNNLSSKIVVKSYHYPFARIDRLSDVADTRSTDTRHKSAKFAKKTCYTATSCPQHGGTWRITNK